MSDPLFLSNADIDTALDAAYRQYLVGDLARPQESDFFRSSQLEVGISRYTAFTADLPHSHDRSIECIYILSGEYWVRLLKSGETRTLGTGDFLAMGPNTGWASKAVEAEVLFVKVPGNNDKKTERVDDATKRWLEDVPPHPKGGEARSTQQSISVDPGLVALYQGYLSDWIHRDGMVWRQAFPLFFASLLAGLMPYLTGYFRVTLPSNTWILNLISLAIAFHFLHVSLAYGVRLQASGESVWRVASRLPAEVQPVRLAELPGWRGSRTLRSRIAYWTPALMFAFLVALNVLVVTLPPGRG